MAIAPAAQGERLGSTGLAIAVALVLLVGPALAWIARGRVPPAVETKTYAGTYRLHEWTTLATATPTGPIHLTVDGTTGKAQGWATGPIGSVRLSGKVRDGNVDVLALSPDGDGRGIGSAKVVGDVMTGSFGIPKMAASASFDVQCEAERPSWKSVAP